MNKFRILLVMGASSLYGCASLDHTQQRNADATMAMSQLLQVAENNYTAYRAQRDLVAQASALDRSRLRVNAEDTERLVEEATFAWKLSGDKTRLTAFETLQTMAAELATRQEQRDQEEAAALAAHPTGAVAALPEGIGTARVKLAALADEQTDLKAQALLLRQFTQDARAAAQPKQDGQDQPASTTSH